MFVPFHFPFSVQNSFAETGYLFILVIMTFAYNIRVSVRFPAIASDSHILIMRLKDVAVTGKVFCLFCNIYRKSELLSVTV